MRYIYLKAIKILVHTALDRTPNEFRNRFPHLYALDNGPGLFQFYRKFWLLVSHIYRADCLIG